MTPQIRDEAANIGNIDLVTFDGRTTPPTRSPTWKTTSRKATTA
jgi:hypothetical protein